MAYGTPGYLATMQARIADEVLGGVTADQINCAIWDAIGEYENERFWFNEARFDQSPLTDAGGAIIPDSNGNPIPSAAILTTTARQEFYPIIRNINSASTNTLAQISHYDRLMILQGGVNRWHLRWRTPQYVDDLSISQSSFAIPDDWTLQGNMLRFFPIPDAAYPVYIVGTRRFDLPMLATDTSPWLVEAEQLTRRRAEQILYRVVLRNPDMAVALQPEIDTAYRSLKRETMTRGGPPQIRPTQF